MFCETWCKPFENPARRLSDIVGNVDAIHSFVGGYDLAAFRADRRTVYAVVRALEIISEASRRIPEEITARHPQIDWVAVAAAGNIYRHEYEAVDEAILWQTVGGGLDELRRVAELELARLQR